MSVHSLRSGDSEASVPTISGCLHDIKVVGGIRHYLRNLPVPSLSIFRGNEFPFVRPRLLYLADCSYPIGTQ